MKRQPDMVSPETSAQEPWFPYADYLILAACSKMMRVTGDDRSLSYWQQAEGLLRPFLIQEGDEQPAVYSARLDPRRFRSNANTPDQDPTVLAMAIGKERPVRSTGGWMRSTPGRVPRCVPGADEPDFRSV